MLSSSTKILQLLALSLVILFSVTQSPAAAPCSSDPPLWCLEWDPALQVWDPDGNKDYQKLPDTLLTVSLVDRKTNQLLVGPVQMSEGNEVLSVTMILDDRIQSRGWTDGVHLHSSSEDEFELRLILHAAPQFTAPRLALPNQDPLPLDAEFYISGSLSLGDEQHVWLFPTYNEKPVIFTRLRAAGADTAKGFGAYVDFHVANRRIKPESLTLHIDGDADGEPERTIIANPWTKTEHQEQIAAAKAKAPARKKRTYIDVPPVDDWKWEWLHPLPSGNMLNDVCLAPNGDLYAVDEAGFVLRRHEGLWAVDGEQLDESLFYVAATPDGEIYVAGLSRIWRRGDNGWIDMEAPQVGHFRGFHAWEGQELVIIAYGGDILHLGADGWQKRSVGQRLMLTGVWGASSDDVWVTGHYGVVFRFDGDAWSKMETPFKENILGVGGLGPNKVYFITARRKARFWRWTERGGWRNVPLPNNPSFDLKVIKGSGESIDLWNGNSYWNYAQQDWIQYEGPSDFRAKSYCRTADGQLVAVGKGGRIEEYGTDGWSEVHPFPRPRLSPVWGLSSSDLFAVGDEGQMWHWDGERLAELLSPTPFSLQGMWGTSSSDIHVAGSHGIWHWDGNSWLQTWEPWRGGVAFGFDLWGSGPANIWAVGSDGVVLHYQGQQWQRVTGLTENNLHSIWGSGPDDIYVGGEETLLHFDGQEWATVPGFKMQRVTALWGSGPSDVWAVTDRGMFHFNGEAWVFNQFRERIRGVWGTGPNNVFTLTDDRLLQFDGTQWRSVRRGDHGVINTLWMREGDDVVGVGSSGGVLVLRR